MLPPLSSGRRFWRALVAAGASLAATAAVTVAIQWPFPALVDIMPWIAAILAILALGTAMLFRGMDLRLLAQSLAIGRKDAHARGLEEATFDGVLTLDANGTIRSANRRAALLFNREPADLVGRAFIEFLTPDGRRRLEDFLDRPADGDMTAELRALRNRDTFTARVSLTPVPGGDGKVHFALLLRDVTAQRAAESDAADSRRRFSDAMEAISEGMSLWDEQDRLVSCNPRFMEFHAAVAHMLVPGCRFEDFVRDSVMFGAPPEAIGRESEWIAERFDRHRRPGIRFLQQSTGGRWLRTVERRTAAGETICVETDVTDEETRLRDIVAARDNAEAASRAKTRLLALMNHEFRTPLNAIIGFAEIMRGEPGDEVHVERYRDYAADIHASGVFLMKTVDDLLELTGLDVRRSPLDEEAVDPRRLVEECCEAVRRSPAGRNRSIIAAAPQGLAAFVADHRLIARCLRRLIEQAAVTARTGDSVTVAAGRDGSGNLALSVTVKGGGFRWRVLRLGTGGGANEHGRGWAADGLALGMTLAELEIQLHGGRLLLDAEGTGGATATLIVPAARVLDSAAAPAGQDA